MKRISTIVITLLLAIGLFSCVTKEKPAAEPVVNTTNGTISGYIKDRVYTFKGIPYAQAERFMPPQNPVAWEGIRECTTFGPIAMQVNSWSPDSVMNEKDLFTVNVWTQGINDGKKRAVMLWLHGGGFAFGASDDPISDGHMLALNEDVVLVSINHRLNILGFLDLSDFGAEYKYSGNVGMLDIIKAMEWVRDNVATFGGDPANVTILGESGGGGKVGTLMCMPPAKDLFHKAIIQSGTLLNVMDKEASAALGKAVLEAAGLTPEQVKGLDTIPYKRLVEIGNEAMRNSVGIRRPGSSRMFGFGPTPDGEVLLQQPFSPNFADISSDIPLLIGSTLNEMMPVAYGEKEMTEEQARERLLPLYAEDTDKFIELYKQTYSDYIPQDLLSIDRVFRPLTIEVADVRSSTANAPTYVYLLKWKSPVDDGTKGSFHGMDIPLAFNNIELGKHWTGDTQESVALAATMSKVWANFAKTGNPNAEGVVPAWKAYSSENGETMIFDSECRIANNHDRELMMLIKARFFN